MKNLLLITLSFNMAIAKMYAQVPAAMPADANDFYNSSMPQLRQPVKNVIVKTALEMKHRKANADSLSQALRRNTLLQGMSSNDLSGVVVLIMVQASKDADTDLKKMVMGISHYKDQQKPDNKNMSADELAAAQNIKLQMIIDHKTDIAEEINYVMKKISAEQQNIINNLR